MDKRYQVFVSSTYDDLQEERQEVMQALLELDCIPSGMELFPAANEDQWTLIKKVIDDCDYYLVIVGGRYGSLGPTGISYTEMEYRYALERSKPVIAFLHKDPGSLASSRCESTTEGKAKLESFRSLAQQKMVKHWTSPADLGSVVSRSLIKLIKQNPAVGWVRADRVPSESASEEILKLKRYVEQLEISLAVATTKAPEDTKDLAQGSDLVDLKYTFSSYDTITHDRTPYSGNLVTTWNDIFFAVSPRMINEASDDELQQALDSFAEAQTSKDLRKKKEFRSSLLQQFTMDEDCFQTIKVQLRALNLIAKSSKQRSIKDTSTYWTLTPYGDIVMTKLRAIRRTPPDVSSSANAS